MAAEECARRFGAIQWTGNDPSVQHMGHLTNCFMSWDSTSVCLCVYVHVWVCLVPPVGVFVWEWMDEKKNVLASKKRRKEQQSEERDKLVSKDTEGVIFHLHLVRFAAELFHEETTFVKAAWNTKYH